jgi:hypothetical protein
MFQFWFKIPHKRKARFVQIELEKIHSTQWKLWGVNFIITGEGIKVPRDTIIATYISYSKCLYDSV